MKSYRAKRFFGLALLIIFLNACGDGGDKSALNSSAPNINSVAPAVGVAGDDIEELGKIIKLPVVPEEATYTEFNSTASNGAPNSSKSNEKRIVAVLKFTGDNAALVSANAARYKLPAPADVDAESWFPPEMVAKSQESGDSSLKGVEYAADDFRQAPFKNGKLTRINETNYFVLELF